MADKNYLCFEAVESTDISFTITGNLTTIPIIYYSINDGSTWNQYTFGNTVSLSIGDKCYWKGDNNSFSENNSNYIVFSSTGKIKASGNIMSLVDSTCESLVIPNDYCFYRLFYNCANLISLPELPAITLATSCYSNMFRGCTGLTSLPSDLLPATTLANNCYQTMFYGCTGLTSLPSDLLPATTLANNCYYMMFHSCSSLTEAPELPATILANYCYYYMFYGCSSLIEAPELPATILADYCYYYMFRGCSSLTKAPELPATTLANSCYYYMFHSCSSLTKAPELPATTLANSCYNYMFYGCTSLTKAPELPATTLANGCYYGMFYGCTSLTEAPELPATTLVTICYSTMFYNCLNIKISEVKTDYYNNVYLIPSNKVGIDESNNTATTSMFSGTGGTFKASPIINKTYYIHSDTITVKTLKNIEEAGSVTQSQTGLAPGASITLSAISNPGYTFVCWQFDDGTLISSSEYTFTVTSGCVVKAIFNPQEHGFFSVTNTSSEAININFSIVGSLANVPTLYYYTDMGQLGKYTFGTNITVAAGWKWDPAETCYFWGDNSYFSTWVTNYIIFNYSASAYDPAASCNVSGNINSLYDSSLKNLTIPSSYFFYNLFGNFSPNSYISFNGLELPAIKLKDCCYYNMFRFSPIDIPPELPATTLAKSCYNAMFRGCSSLTEAPELPVTTLVDSCYNYMFYGCTSLTEAPELPSTTLATNCYSNMFWGCSSLTEAPELPATTLADSCYYYMFYGCSSLTEAPELPATTLADSCYFAMFQGCTSLKIQPKLSANTLTNKCYQYMFSGCSSLQLISKLPATYIPSGSYRYMFQGCTSIYLNNIKMSNDLKPYRIPSAGTGSVQDNTSLEGMFNVIIGPVVGTPSINTQYYTNENYTAYINVEPRGSGSVTLDKKIYSKGDITNIVPTPTRGFRFWRWRFNDTGYYSQDNPLTLEIEDDLDITAQFESSIPINIFGSGEVLSYYENGLFIFSAFPSSHYKFEKYIINGVEYTDQIFKTEYYEELIINAYFTYIGKEFVVYSSGHGSVTSSVESGQIYDSGTEITVEAINPQEHYHFDGWYIGEQLISAANPYTFNLISDTTLEAFFDEDDTFYIYATSNVGGSNVFQSAEKVYMGESVTLIARDVAGYVFSNWSDGDTNATKIITVTQDIYIEAVYIKVEIQAKAYDWYAYIKAKESLNGRTKCMLSVLEFTLQEDLITTANSTFVIKDIPEEVSIGDVLCLYNTKGECVYYGIIESIDYKTSSNTSSKNQLKCSQMQEFYKGNWVRDTYSTATCIEDEFRYLLDRYANGYMKGSSWQDTLQQSMKGPLKVKAETSLITGHLETPENNEVEDMSTFIYNLYEKYGLMLEFYVPIEPWDLGSDNGGWVKIFKNTIEIPLRIIDGTTAIRDVIPTDNLADVNKLIIYNSNGVYRSTYVYQIGTGAVKEPATIGGRIANIKTSVVFSDDPEADIVKANIPEEMFNHKITFDLLIDNNLYKLEDFKLGIPLQVWNGDSYYTTILTGYKYVKAANENLVTATFTCGKARTSLTKKLARKLGVI